MDWDIYVQTSSKRKPHTKYHRHIRQLAEAHNVPMPTIDVANQHMLSARAHGGAEMDWTALVGGQRIAAGLQPFEGRVSDWTRASTSIRPEQHGTVSKGRRDLGINANGDQRQLERYYEDRDRD